MNRIQQFLLSKYQQSPELIVKKTKTLINTVLVFFVFITYVTTVHIIGGLPKSLLVSDFAFLLGGVFTLVFIKQKQYEIASNFVIVVILATITFQLPFRDWFILNSPQPHLRFLETEVLLIASLSIISLCVYHNYQIFLHIFLSTCIVLGHYFIIIHKYHQGIHTQMSVADITIYLIVMILTGCLANYIFLLNEKLIIRLAGEANKVKEFNLTLQAKVEQRTQELEKEKEDLAKANFELDKFVYSVSHDLRSPLVSALGLIALMKDETSLNSLLYYMQMLENLMLKLDALIKDILDLSINSRQPAQNEIIDLQKLFDDVFESNKFYHSLRSIEKEITVHTKVPLYSDRKRLVIIFNNLITNAIKYSCERANEKSYIRIKASSFSDYALIEVEDNGEGIETEHLEKIYEMFFRATTNSHGSGLGLYIVKETLAKLSGNIQVASESGSWTRFTIRIPNNYNPELFNIPLKEKISDKSVIN